MLYEILTVADTIPRTMSPRVARTVPCTRAISRFTQSEQKTKVYPQVQSILTSM